MKYHFFLLTLSFLVLACKKGAENFSNGPGAPDFSFTEYIIEKGSNYCTSNPLRPLSLTRQDFVVRFDSSAVYQTLSTSNQNDINKLYGFSDNNADHHEYSARFGWRWSDTALRLFAYTYNEGVRSMRELAVVPIGPEIHCSIQVTQDSYLFTVNGVMTRMSRSATTKKAEGYQLYPYFGGEEPAPHQVHIWIRPLN